VRRVEARVRQAIDLEVGAGETAYSHSVWRRAVGRLTSNNFILHRVEFSSAEQLFKEIGDRTGIRSAALMGNVLSAAASQTPIMTSFSQIGSNSYNTGHIVTVLGLDEAPNGPRSAVPRLLLLNSAVKVDPTNPQSHSFSSMCDSKSLPGDRRYVGALSLEREYVLKTYGGKFVGFWITRR
jgi:hypothetical protein